MKTRKSITELVGSIKCPNMRGVGQNRSTEPIPSYRTIKHSDVLVGGSGIPLVTKNTLRRSNHVCFWDWVNQSNWLEGSVCRGDDLHE